MLARIATSLALTLCLIVSAVFGAQFGQIGGTITDRETGNPLVGVTVAVIGTSYWVQTDLDGKYRLHRLEPGKYRIRMATVGYASVEVNEVIVDADLITELSQQMEKAVTDLDKTITVKGKQEIMYSYGGHVSSRIHREEIKPETIMTVDELLEQVIGSSDSSNQKIRIRGGSDDQDAWRLGTIKGIITDKETGKPIIGASIAVLGTSLGAQTDLDGQYTIARIAPGTYVLRITSVGFSALEVTNVEVEVGRTTDMSWSLEWTTCRGGLYIDLKVPKDMQRWYEATSE